MAPRACDERFVCVERHRGVISVALAGHDGLSRLADPLPAQSRLVLRYRFAPLRLRYSASCASSSNGCHVLRPPFPPKNVLFSVIVLRLCVRFRQRPM